MKMKQKRKRDLEKELERILKVIVTDYKPNKVILFGSLVTNRVRETSDIDLLIVKDTKKRYWDRIDDVIHLVHPQEALDVFVLTSKEIDRNLKSNQYLEEILGTGKVLYEKTN